MAASTPTHFPQLVNTEVFDNWLFRLNCMLEERGLKEVTQMEKVEDKSLDAKAKSLIVQCVTDRHLNLIKESKTSKEMIDTMKNTFQRKSVISKITLRRKLLNLKHTYASLEEYFSQFDNVIRELEVAGEKIEENDKVCYLLTGLGDEYNHIITAIETMNTE
ncbi:Yokozuna protein, partial [Operophtera brumata]